ncbi:paraquat-inducible protein A [Yoonia tamlensis]|uniref:Paraquat-inducible protein A n=1 Tax=Yoonia tamlensis TaxID=390270 RepID=A0A1I6GKA5_9RHOB|nr:paraquat-inducible protein A [Yoonia tamlensis]SFR42624.1 paraquat-inducible protein A [Yoonia tamlensis]
MSQSLPPLDDLVACHHCDTLHVAQDLPDRARAYCQRCGSVMMTTQSTAIARVLSLAITAFVLLIAAISFPFLALDAKGLHNTTSVIDAVLAFNEGYAFPLAVAVAFFIIIIPLTRLGALIYALGPLARDKPAHAGAKRAFGLAEQLRPWSMAEIFIVGVTVALIKVAGLAAVTIGPAFWAFAGVVIVTVLKDQMICRYSIWEALEQQPD